MSSNKLVQASTRMRPELRTKVKSAASFMGEEMYIFIDRACCERLRNLTKDGQIPDGLGQVDPL